MTQRRVSCLVMLLGVLLCAPTASRAQSRPTEPRTLTVIGQAELSASPDRAVVLVGVRTRGESAAEAARENARRSKAVLESLRAHLDPADRTETGAYRIEPVHEFHENRPPRVVAYDALNTLRIETRRVDALGPLLDAASGAADVSVESISFELADPAAKQAEVLAQAAQRARARAQSIAQGLGVRLGRIVRAHEQGAMPPPLQPLAMARGAMEMKADVPTQILPQELTLMGAVEVSFEIE